MRNLLLALALGLLAGTAFAKPTPDTPSAAPPVPATTGAPRPVAPTTDEAEAAIWATRFLTRFAYRAVPLDNAMSEEIYKRYLDALDGDRLFFMQADVDQFDKYRDKLDDAIYDQDLAAPFTIFNVYEQRVGERVGYALSLLPKGFDFTKDESYRYDRSKLPWEKDTASLNDVWRKRVKNDWLRLKLAGKSDADIRETLHKRYQNYLDRVRQLESADVFQTFLNSYAQSIGPHTNYLGPRASENFDIAMKLSLEGIGAVLQLDDDYTAIREIVPGGPAALSGQLRPGDRIVGVGQGASGPITDVVGWRLDDVVEKIRGPKDTVVRLEILPADAGPDGKHEMLALTRKKVSIEEQAAKKSIIQVKDGNQTRRIGVIDLPTFYQDFDARSEGDKNYKSATRDVAALLAELKQDKVDGVIMDLRNDGGGSLSEAVSLTGLFIDKGPVVQVRNANGKVEKEDDEDPGMAWSGPFAVLVNRGSASASEIFTAAIQDYGRGIVIGEPTFGKGTVQNLVDLDQVAHNEKPIFGELKMTIAQFFRVNGGSTQLRGVTPDISFPMTIDAKDFGESSYDNALPWSSIPAAPYKPVADLKPLVPMLAERHQSRVAKDVAWQNFEADVADMRALRADKTVSLDEAVRRKQRDDEEAKRKLREARADHAPSSPDKTLVIPPSIVNPAGVHSSAGPVNAPVTSVTTAATGAEGVSPPDDGLQPNERSIQSDLKREKDAKQQRDVVLDEAANILSDEVGLIQGDTKLAAEVLPHNTIIVPPETD